MIEKAKIFSRGGKCLPGLLAALTVVATSNLAQAESFGIKFLGDTGDQVTGTAGIVPIGGWNNISNKSGIFTSGQIKSSDGTVTATLTLTGSGAANGWHTGATADGADGSLMRGYIDAMHNGPATNTISGLTGSSYTVYLYTQGDAARPSNGGDWLPNYSINGTSISAPTLGNGSYAYVQSGFTLVNNNTYPSPLTSGNYIKWDNAVPIGGVVTIVADGDNKSWRAPINGIELVLNTVAIAPHITKQTGAVTNYEGETVQLVVVSDGTPLNYQWMGGAIGSGTYTNLVNAGNISGVNKDTLVVSNAGPANMADYVVVISNSAGSDTSPVASSLYVSPMALGADGLTPSAAVLYPGGNVNFQVTVLGPPSSYHWRKNGQFITDGANITGSKSNILSLVNVTAADVANYDVVVTNSYRTVGSTTAVLSLTSAPVSGSYPAAVAAKGPLAYWRFNETSDLTAYDSVGGHNAAYGVDTALGMYNGPTPPAFPGFESDNWSADCTYLFPNSAMAVPANNSPNLSTNTVTLTAWIYPFTLPKNSGIIFMRSSTGVAGLVLGGTGNLGYNWNDDAATWSWDSGLTVPKNEWTFVSLVIAPTQATVYMCNAEGANSAIFTHNHANGPANQSLCIGTDPWGTDGGRVFNGAIDEVAVYNRALGNDEVVDLFTHASPAGVKPAIAQQPVAESVLPGTNVQFSIVATGSTPLHYQWQRNGVNLLNSGNITGADTATLNLASVTTANGGLYQVVVSNPVGSVTSSVAKLIVVTGTNYDANILAMNPAGYWPLNETSGTLAADLSAHAVNGTYLDQVILGASAPSAVTSGYGTNDFAAGFNGTANSWVSLSGLNVNSANATFMAWINPATLSTTPDTGLIFCRDGVGTTSGLGLNPGGVLGYTWNNNADTYGWQTGLIPPTNTWSFVALVVTPTNATIYLYNTNGQSVATHAHNHPVQAFSGETRIGNDALSTDWTFNGLISRAAVFTSALGAAQLGEVYTKGNNGGTVVADPYISITKSGSALQLQWTGGQLVESTNVVGPWTTNSSAISPFTVSPTASQKFYRVK